MWRDGASCQCGLEGGRETGQRAAGERGFPADPTCARLAYPDPLIRSCPTFFTASAARTLKQAFTGGLSTFVLPPIGARLPPGSINSNIPGLYSSPATGSLPFNTLIARILPQFAPGTPAQLVQNNPFAFIANPNGGPLGQFLLWWGGNARPIALPTLPTPTGPSGAARYDFNNPATFALRASGQIDTNQLTFVNFVSYEERAGRGAWARAWACVPFHLSVLTPFFPFPHKQTGRQPGGHDHAAGSVMLVVSAFALSLHYSRERERESPALCNSFA